MECSNQIHTYVRKSLKIYKNFKSQGQGHISRSNTKPYSKVRKYPDLGIYGIESESDQVIV